MNDKNIKILTSEETNSLIEGIENGEIIIYSPERTPEEEKEWLETIGSFIRKRKEEYRKNTPFIKRIKRKFYLKYLCYKYRLEDFNNSLKYNLYEGYKRRSGIIRLIRKRFFN